MPVMPYQPMHKEQAVTQDRMQEILKKNAKTWPTAPKENASSIQLPRTAGKLVWADRDPGSMGRYDTTHWYSVCQTNHPGPVFTAWTRNPLTSGMRMLECGLPSFRAAIEICQKDADEHYARGDR